jgi:polysaccharide export outer membrane protein
MKVFLVLALGFFVINQRVIVKAQALGQGANPAPPPLPTSSAAPSAAPHSQEFLINPNDVLDIYVFDVPELSHAYTVSPSGVVSMPLLPAPVQAAGLTLDQLARAMEEAFRQSGRLRRPEIAVSFNKRSIASSVAVEGAVKNPLILSESGRTPLVDILTQCGGLADDAGATVTVTRGPLALRNLAAEGGTATPTLTLELKKVMDVSDPASTVAVWPGDRVSVERERPDVYYVLGEVKAPGGYTLKKGHEELTVLRALALAGDATGVAKRSQALIIRKDPKGPLGREAIKLDLQRILHGKSPDLKLQADDILYIPGSTGKKAMRAIEAAPSLILADAGAAAIIAH